MHFDWLLLLHHLKSSSQSFSQDVRCWSVFLDRQNCTVSRLFAIFYYFFYKHLQLFIPLQSQAVMAFKVCRVLCLKSTVQCFSGLLTIEKCKDVSADRSGQCSAVFMKSGLGRMLCLEGETLPQSSIIKTANFPRHVKGLLCAVLNAIQRWPFCVKTSFTSRV